MCECSKDTEATSSRVIVQRGFGVPKEEVTCQQNSEVRTGTQTSSVLSTVVPALSHGAADHTVHLKCVFPVQVSPFCLFLT
jgi:hypothetical protein